MQINELIAELKSEAAITRRFLERVPADRLDWRPHDKSNTVGQLALHIASVPMGITKAAEMDAAPTPDFSKGFTQPASLEAVLSKHDEAVGYALAQLPAMADKLDKTWTATSGSQTLMSIPRSAMLRSLLLNHWIQHRGQLGVYLRLLGAKVPASYGPSADESPFG
jgi:uncharacterized damage-inducible protein DinB